LGSTEFRDVPGLRVQNPAQAALQSRDYLENRRVRRDRLEHVRDEAELRTNGVEDLLRAGGYILWRGNIQS